MIKPPGWIMTPGSLPSNKFCGLSLLHPCATGWLPARCAVLLSSWGHRLYASIFILVLLCRSHRTVPSFFNTCLERSIDLFGCYSAVPIGLYLLSVDLRSIDLFGCYFAVSIGLYLLSVDFRSIDLFGVTLQCPSDCTFSFGKFVWSFSPPIVCAVPIDIGINRFCTVRLLSLFWLYYITRERYCQHKMSFSVIFIWLFC